MVLQTPSSVVASQSPGSVAFRQWEIQHLKKEGCRRVDRAGLHAAWDALPAEVKRAHNSFGYMFKNQGNGGGLGLTMDLLYAELEEPWLPCIQKQHENAEKRPA